MTLVKTNCSRCNGSGKFSFNLVRGTVCFGCEGSGFRMVDPVKEAAKKTAAEKRKQANEAKRETVIAATNAVLVEMNLEFDNKFDIETQLGIDQLNKAVAGKYNKSIWVIRDERLK